jgi:type IX secretion system PorP/SprF family membrane protein
MVGSKDFLSLDLNASFKGKSGSQILSGNTRLSKTKSGYFSSPDILEFNNIGLGGSVFNNIDGASQNIGISTAGSYQIPLNTRKLSFLSFGASVKGVYNKLDADTIEPTNPAKKTFYPNVDVGIYYYGTKFFTGLSAINLLRNPEKPDSLGVNDIPVYRQYFFTAGYKIPLSKSMNIVLEPSILFNAYDSTLKNIEKNFNPILKLYVENFCIGSYFLNDGAASFFFQYRYPRFYIGAFYELPKKSPYYKKSPTIEITLGLNFQTDKSRFSKSSRW